MRCGRWRGHPRLGIASADKLVSYKQAAVQQAATNVVISEFRSRGPSTNGYDTDEFVELFNPTDSAAPSSDWTLWRGGCSALNLIATIPSGVIPAHKHYLIGGENYSGSAAPDLTVNIGLSDDNGAIELQDGSLNIMDTAGTCDGLAPLQGNSDQSYDRIAVDTSCQDSGVNTADFFLRRPSDPQNRYSPIMTCGNPTPTPVHTATATVRPTSTPAGFRRLTINEVGWAGTKYSSSDQWIELANTSGGALDLTGWALEDAYGTVIANLRGILLPTPGFYLLVHGKPDAATQSAIGTPTAPASDCVVFQRQDVTYDQVFTAELNTAGQRIYLINENGGIEDTADRYGYAWPAGKSNPATSMERSNSALADTTLGAWFSFDGDPVALVTARDCGNYNVRGTPKDVNWAVGKIATPSPTLSIKKPTLAPPTPFAHMVINEFLPRAGTDWNQDGKIDVYDEFIELKNLGPIDVDLKNWKLDDAENAGSTPYTLPSQKVAPGERVVYYHATTNIALPDSGDVVRLINPSGVVIDARSYGPVGEADVSHCRIPDGYYWQTACFPTPGLENKLTGTAPSAPPAVSQGPPPCLLADSVPAPFRDAECNGYGADMWDRTYWDKLAGQGQFTVPDIYGKAITIVQ